MFKVVLTNEHKNLDLIFSIRDSNIAKKWYKQLKNNYSLYEVNRFSNWGNNDFIKKLNYHIDVVNAYDFKIDKHINKTSTQQDLNYLHKFFETLRGEVNKKTKWFKTAPKEVQQSVERFNILIHQYESTLRTKDKHPTIVVTFNDRPRLKLSQDDMKHFTYKWKSGTVYINYCQVGKTVLDAFKDNDSIAEVRPQTHYSADFMIKFGPSTNPFVYAIRSTIINVWLLIKRFKFNNLNIGMIPVADLVTKVDKQELLQYNKVKEVQCIK